MGPLGGGLVVAIETAVGQGLGNRLAIHAGFPCQVRNRAGHAQDPFAGAGTQGPVLEGGAPEVQGFGFEVAAPSQLPGTQAAVGAAAGIALGHALAGLPDPFGHLGRRSRGARRS